MSGKYAVLYKKAFGKVKYSLEMYKEMGAATTERLSHQNVCTSPHLYPAEPGSRCSRCQPWCDHTTSAYQHTWALTLSNPQLGPRFLSVVRVVVQVCLETHRRDLKHVQPHSKRTNMLVVCVRSVSHLQVQSPGKTSVCRAAVCNNITA